MAFRYRSFRRVLTLVPQLLSGQGCHEWGEATKLASSLIPLAHTLEFVDKTAAWRGLHISSGSFSRLSTFAETSKGVSHELDLVAFIRSTLDHVEGPSHRWINISDSNKEFLNKDGATLLVAGAFLDDPAGSQVDQINMLGKVKLVQQRYPWIQILGFRSCSSICSTVDHDHLVNIIMEEYITFPILLCSKIFPEIAAGGCMLLKGLKDPPLYHGKDIDLSTFIDAIKDLGQQIKHAGSANKLDSPWSKHCEEFKEPYACSYMQNLILSLPACISADGSGNRIFISDSNHHRVVIFDDNGTILDVIGSSPGFEDGDFESAKLMRPAASYYHASEDCLYIVDSENHAIRRADFGKRVLETLHAASIYKDRNGFWTWILDKLGFRRDAGMKPVEFDSESLLFPWHLLKSVDDELLIMNKRFNSLWIMDIQSGMIRNVVKGQKNMMEICGQQIVDKVSPLKDLSHDFLQQLVYSRYMLGDITNSGLVSSFIARENRLLLCDTVAQRVLMIKKDDTSASIEFSNLGNLGLPYWLSCCSETAFTTSNVYKEAHVDHLQSFTLFPGKVDVHLIIDIPGDTELVEPLEESCVWRHVRGAALDVSRMDSTVTTVEKVGVAQKWYDDLDGLAFEVKPEVSSEVKTTPERNLEDGKIHIECAINTSPGTSEVIILAPLYLKIRNSLKTCKENQEKAAIIAEILKPDRRSARHALVRSLLSLKRDLGEVVFIKPLFVKLKFEILNPPNAQNSRDIILTDSAVDVNVSLS
ncbi:uncharacterized protein LOC130813203 isoform X2 [Amaranthus tricolor]|uniref:uncharacterized protein LOC130813203 isoform X2 n=1 Tax=Amaranthus tricolor TaxID=29722 RepID=UPI0025873583|nr:uncharacterized protein LOC130813203 isoform X2 [Amaranthus tricolor]XP_057534952.1 uncharacterized protein LOC130813203 isoform X2 [Amaranthus tricolor]